MLYVVTGPESCGKSTLSQALGERFGVPVIPEAARHYLVSQRYESSDLLAIAGLQSEWERIDYRDFAVADTDLQVTGGVATDWMSKAQCFAGAPETPPAPGTRFTK